MSKRVAPNPLLIRVRFSNPLPPPPFPPKLLSLKTDPARFSHPEFLSGLDSEREIPVIIPDAEAGMPIELGREKTGDYGLCTYWEGDRSVITADPHGSDLPTLDPEDLALLIDPPTLVNNAAGLKPSAATNGSITSATTNGVSSVGAINRRTDVSWLRRTEYFGDVSNKSKDTSPRKRFESSIPLKRSRHERIPVIEATFAACSTPISQLSHPTKPHLKAESSYSFLPDQDTWSNTYQMCRFAEDPSIDLPLEFIKEDEQEEQEHEEQRATDLEQAPSQLFQANDTRLRKRKERMDEKLRSSVIRPVVVRGEARMCFYLPKHLSQVKEYKQRKLEMKTVDEIQEGEPSTRDEDHCMYVAHVRDYQLDNEGTVNNRLLLALHDGSESKPAGAYYTNLAKYTNLRRRRARAKEDPKVYDDEDEAKFFDGYIIRIADGQQTATEWLDWKALRVALSEQLAEPVQDAEGEVEADGDGDADGETEGDDVEADLSVTRK